MSVNTGASDPMTNAEWVIRQGRRDGCCDAFSAYDAGGRLASGPRLRDQYRRAASVGDQIRPGPTPADLPVAPPTTGELVINLKTAQTLGLAIPPARLCQATAVRREHRWAVAHVAT